MPRSQSLKPIYTPANCNPAYQLNWSLSLFWRLHNDKLGTEWLPSLKMATEKDGVRILEYRNVGSQVSQFLLSTKPATAPQAAIRSVKGRLQYLIRDIYPKAFQRNYSLHSIGSAKREVIEGYVSTQLGHHKMADRNVQERLAQYQIKNLDVDLSQPVRSSHGLYVYNLHLVLVNSGRWVEIRDDILSKVRNMIINISKKNRYRLSAAGIFPDHIHLTLGSSIGDSPEVVALSFLNNLAYAQGMRPIYQAGYYAGTFGEYDLGAVRL